MPTGYTAPVGDGEVTDLKEFAASCARGFGAFIHMRDDSGSAALRFPDPPDHSYYSKNLARTKESLREWQSMSEEERYAKWSQYYNNTVVSNHKTMADKSVTESNYRNMLVQVVSIEVPPELENFKNFMIEQLNDSIKFDCDSSFNQREPLDYSTWCDSHSEMVLRSAVNAEKHYNEEVARYNERCRMINLFAETFGFEVVE
jgi:hypothetical protein